jgi:hypothetical protein
VDRIGTMMHPRTTGIMFLITEDIRIINNIHEEIIRKETHPSNERNEILSVHIVMDNLKVTRNMVVASIRCFSRVDLSLPLK